MAGEVRVDALRIGFKYAAGLGVQLAVFFLRDALPSHGTQEDIGLELRLAEHFRQAASSNVTEEIHLPEAVLGVDIPLCEEQIVFAAGVNVRHTGRTSVDIHRGFQARNCLHPLGPGERTADQPGSSCGPDERQYEKNNARGPQQTAGLQFAHNSCLPVGPIGRF